MKQVIASIAATFTGTMVALIAGPTIGLLAVGSAFFTLWYLDVAINSK
jgi:1,4-dihydroxy-2-naphthoate octaprenyltransferase